MMIKLLGWVKKWVAWHPNEFFRCIYDSSRICYPEGCPAYSEKEILLVISDIEGNQLKTRCKELAIKGAHIEALKVFNQDFIRGYMKQLARESERLKQEKQFTQEGKNKMF